MYIMHTYVYVCMCVYIYIYISHGLVTSSFGACVTGSERETTSADYIDLSLLEMRFSVDICNEILSLLDVNEYIIILIDTDIVIIC